MAFVGLAIVLAALAAGATSGSKIDETLDRTVAPASDPLAPAGQQGDSLNAPVVSPSPAPSGSAAPAEDPLADVAQ
jgi:hypothetical protein